MTAGLSSEYDVLLDVLRNDSHALTGDEIIKISEAAMETKPL